MDRSKISIRGLCSLSCKIQITFGLASCLLGQSSVSWCPRWSTLEQAESHPCILLHEEAYAHSEHMTSSSAFAHFPFFLLCIFCVSSSIYKLKTY